MSNNSWGQPPRQPFSAPQHPQQPYASGPHPGFGSPVPPGFQPGHHPGANPGMNPSVNHGKRTAWGEKVFPLGMLALLVFSFASAFLRYYTLTGLLWQDHFVEVRNLWGHSKNFREDGTIDTGFDFSMEHRGEIFNQWTAVPIATVIVLVLLLTSVMFARNARTWWVTPVSGLVASLTQFFWVLHLANFRIVWLFEDAATELQFEQYGTSEFTIGPAIWCWMLLGIAGAAMSVFELLRMKRSGQARALFDPVSVTSSQQWILLAALGVLAFLFAVMSLNAAARMPGREASSWFYAFAYGAFLISILGAGILGWLRRWALAWVTAATASAWLCAWFFATDLQIENATWREHPIGAAVWIVCALGGVVVSALGLRLTARTQQQAPMSYPSPQFHPGQHFHR